MFGFGNLVDMFILSMKENIIELDIKVECLIDCVKGVFGDLVCNKIW